MRLTQRVRVRTHTQAGVFSGTYLSSGKSFPYDGWDSVISKTTDLLEVLHVILPKFVTVQDLADMIAMIKCCRTFEIVDNDINWEACKVLLVDQCIAKFLAALRVWRLGQDEHGREGPLLANFIRLRAPEGSTGVINIHKGCEQLAMRFERFRQGHVFTLAAADLPKHAKRVLRRRKGGKADARTSNAQPQDASAKKVTFAEAASDNDDGGSMAGSGTQAQISKDEIAAVAAVCKACRMPNCCPTHICALAFPSAVSKCAPGCKRGSHPDKLNNQHYKQFADASGLAGLKAKHLAARGTKNKGGRGRGGANKKKKKVFSTESAT